MEYRESAIITRKQPLPTNDSALRKETAIKAGHEVFKEYLEKDNRLREDDFVALWKKDPVFYAAYSPENIAKDKAKIEEMKNSANFEKEGNYAIVLENMFADVVEKGKFFGEGRYAVTQLSEFDDKAIDGAHCDCLLELEVDGAILSLGIDLTTAQNYNTLNEKRKKCIKGAKDGKFSSIKYGKSGLSDAMGRVNMVPVVVAGLDKDTVADLCAAMGRGDDLSAHYAKIIVLDEIVHELGRLVVEARFVRGKNDEIADALDYYREVFIGIEEKYKSLRTFENSAKAKADKAYKFLTAYF